MGQVGRLGPKVGGHLALLLHSSREPGELSQCPKHDDSTINIVVVIIIIIISLSSFYMHPSHKKYLKKYINK